MRNYEAVCVFRTDEDNFPKGQEAIKAHLADLGATFIKEEDMGQRALAYSIKKQVQGHYYVYYVQMDPQQAHQVEDKVRHQEQLLRFLMVRRDEDEKVAPEKPGAAPERDQASPEQPAAAPEEPAAEEPAAEEPAAEEPAAEEPAAEEPAAEEPAAAPEKAEAASEEPAAAPETAEAVPEEPKKPAEPTNATEGG